jgi:hypothetical protein
VEDTVLSVFVLIVDWRQRFTKAGARYDAPKRGSLLVRRSVTSRAPESDDDGRACVPFCWRLRRRNRNKISNKSRATPATLPTTPPTIFGVVVSEAESDPDEDSELVLVGDDPLLVPPTV